METWFIARGGAGDRSGHAATEQQYLCILHDFL